MGCEYQERNIDRLLEYASDANCRAGSAEVLSHLKHCAECARLISEQQAVWRSLDHWHVPEVSSRFETVLWRRLEDPASRRQPWSERLQNWIAWKATPGLPIAAACATVAVVLTLSLPWMTHTRSVIHSEKVDMEQIEKTVNDMDLLRTLTPVAGVTTVKRDASL